MVGTGRIPILPKIAVVVGIDPKPGHDALFWSVVTENFEKKGGKVQILAFFENPKKSRFSIFGTHIMPM